MQSFWKKESTVLSYCTAYKYATCIALFFHFLLLQIIILKTAPCSIFHSAFLISRLFPINATLKWPNHKFLLIRFCYSNSGTAILPNLHTNRQYLYSNFPLLSDHIAPYRINYFFIFDSTVLRLSEIYTKRNWSVDESLVISDVGKNVQLIFFSSNQLTVEQLCKI